MFCSIVVVVPFRHRHRPRHQIIFANMPSTFIAQNIFPDWWCLTFESDSLLFALFIKITSNGVYSNRNHKLFKLMSFLMSTICMIALTVLLHQRLRIKENIYRIGYVLRCCQEFNSTFFSLLLFFFFSFFFFPFIFLLAFFVQLWIQAEIIKCGKWSVSSQQSAFVIISVVLLIYWTDPQIIPFEMRTIYIFMTIWMVSNKNSVFFVAFLRLLFVYAMKDKWYEIGGV